MCTHMFLLFLRHLIQLQLRQINTKVRFDQPIQVAMDVPSAFPHFTGQRVALSYYPTYITLTYLYKIDTS